VYYNSDRKRAQLVEMTPTILSQMATYYKTDPETFIEAYGSSGVDLKKYAPAGNINTSKKSGGSTKKPEPAKEKKEEGYMVNGKLIKPRGK
jgi:hypothetical protein